MDRTRLLLGRRPFLIMRSLLLFSFVVACSICQAATNLVFSTTLSGRTQFERSRIDTAHLVQIHDFVVFAGTDETHFPSVARGPNWYDLVAFDCRSNEFKVLFAVEQKDDPKTMEEMLVDSITAQEDARAYGYLHDWSAVRGLDQILRKRCGKSPKSTFRFLPYHLTESDNTGWWIDLATIEVTSESRTFFAFSKPYQIETRMIDGTATRRIAFKREGDATYHWSVSCAKKTLAVLSFTRYSRTGAVLEDKRDTAPPVVALPNTIGRTALEFICALRK